MSMKLLRYISIFRYFSFYKQLKFRAHEKSFITLAPVLKRQTVHFLRNFLNLKYQKKNEIGVYYEIK